MRRKMFLMFGLGMMAAALPLYVVACGIFPSKDDVNTLQRADHTYVAGEHQATRDQMTEQHTIQTPEAADLLAQVNADAAAAVKELLERVLAVEAQGADLGEFGGMNDWITALAVLLSGGTLGGVVSGMGKPSRATPRIDALEKATTERIATLELALATAAKAGAPIPSDGPGLPVT